MTNLRHALAGELRRRPYGRAVRLEINADCSPSITSLLTQHFRLEAHEVLPVDGPVNLVRLQALAEAVEHLELRFPPFAPGPPQPELPDERVFAELRQRDILLHHPYQSFEPVVQFIRCAVEDPNVIAIRQTIYRTGSKSALMDLLLEAVRRGKEVTVVLELKARLTKKPTSTGPTNWSRRAPMWCVWSGRPQDARQDGADIATRRQCHPALCAYRHRQLHNPNTACFYTDFGPLTAHREIVRDVAAIFITLTSLSQPPRLKHPWWAPHTMKNNLLAAIAAEVRAAKSGKPARIMARVNALTDEVVMTALCTASEAASTSTSSSAAPAVCVRVSRGRRRACAYLDRWPLSPAQPGLLLRKWRRTQGLHFQRRLDEPQPRSPRRSSRAGARSRTEKRVIDEGMHCGAQRQFSGMAAGANGCLSPAGPGGRSPSARSKRLPSG